jgi:RimJ/RimL family protein N-acetyltransferase
MWGDEETTRHIGGRPSTPEESWSRLLRTAGHWALLNYGFWALRHRESGRFVGEFGFKQFRRSLDPALETLPEAGWVLAPWARGQGFASEATAAILAWADAEAGWTETLCMIDPGNAASLRIATSRGYIEHSRAIYHDKPVILLRRPGLSSRVPGPQS